MRIGERIKKYREIRELSQQDLSAAAGVSLGLIQQIEQGRHNNPSIKVLEKIAVVFDLDIVHLLKDPLESKIPADKIDTLRKKVKVILIPLFDSIPNEDDLKLKSLSKVKGLVPLPNNQADYALHLNKDFSVSGTVRSNDFVSIRRSKILKDNNVYLFTTKDKKPHIGLCKIYDGGIAFFRSQNVTEPPIEYNKKNITIVGEVVSWLKSPANDSLPLSKIVL